MKDKKKVGLVKRIAAGVCALMMVVGCLGSDAVYASEYYYTTEYRDFLLPVDVDLDKYPYYVVGYSLDDGDFIICFYESLSNVSVSIINSFHYISITNSDLYYYSSNGIDWNIGPSSGFTIYSNSFDSGRKICYVNFDIYTEDGELVCYAFGSTSGGTYNSSLGYLQNILCKELYLEDADYAYDPNALKKVWTFGNTSTSGLDITDGSYSIRHYQQITVRDTDILNPVVKEYDMILMNEFPAASLRYEYMSKDYTSRLETESEFEPLGFWETSILGQFVFTRNYFQLVRTNEDGSVEYGGYVKIDLKGSPAANDFNAEHETTTMTPEGETDLDGYVGGNMDYIQGSGSDYGQAENNADKNYENESSSSSGSNDIVTQLENFSAVVMAVPRLIAELFSFLPDWCLDFVGAAFSISVAILVYKLAN